MNTSPKHNSSTEEILARVGAILELAIRGHHDARNPGDPVALASEAHDLLRRYKHVLDRLIDALEELDPA